MHTMFDDSHIHLSLENITKDISSQEIPEDLQERIRDIIQSIHLFIDHSYDSQFFLKSKHLVTCFAELGKKLKVIEEKLKKLPIDAHPTLPDLIKQCGDAAKTVAKHTEAVTADQINLYSQQKSREEMLLASHLSGLKPLYRTILKNRINWSECIKNPSLHPEWPLFQQQMLKYKMASAEIAEIWNLMIFGIAYQMENVQIGNAKAGNPFFILAAEQLARADLLSSEPDQPSAFWSGGNDISLYALQHGFTTLEKTKAGVLIDNLLLHHDWNIISPFWNEVSRQYARQSTGKVHFFFRVAVPQSTFQSIELKEIEKLMQQGVIEEIVFHPLINRGTYGMDALDMFEIRVIEEYRRNPRVLLKHVLTKITQLAINKHPEAILDQESIEFFKVLYAENKRAASQMKID